jgi:hypothetical protein
MHGPRQATIAKLPDGQINRLSRTDVQPYSKNISFLVLLETLL